jgi:hypothetical protein
MAGLGNGKVSQFHSAVAGEHCSKHCLIHIINITVAGISRRAFLDEALQKRHLPVNLSRIKLRKR